LDVALTPPLFRGSGSYLPESARFFRAVGIIPSRPKRRFSGAKHDTFGPQKADFSVASDHTSHLVAGGPRRCGKKESCERQERERHTALNPVPTRGLGIMDTPPQAGSSRGRGTQKQARKGTPAGDIAATAAVVSAVRKPASTSSHASSCPKAPA
jgi:hypothetical protein